MRPSSFTSTESIGTFRHSATSSFYGTPIDPPLELEVTFELHRGRPVFRTAIDRRGVSHEIELLSKSEMLTSYEKSHAAAEPVLSAE